MDYKSRFMILLIPGMGIAALLVLIWEEIPPLFRILVPAGALALFVLLRVIAWGRSLRPGISDGTKARIVGARAGDGIGEFTVNAYSSQAVLDDLKLPQGAKITTVLRNHVYRVELPTDRKSVIEAIARRNGYSGEVG